MVLCGFVSVVSRKDDVARTGAAFYEKAPLLGFSPLSRVDQGVGQAVTVALAPAQAAKMPSTRTTSSGRASNALTLLSEAGDRFSSAAGGHNISRAEDADKVR